MLGMYFTASSVSMMLTVSSIFFAVMPIVAGSVRRSRTVTCVSSALAAVTLTVPSVIIVSGFGGGVAPVCARPGVVEKATNAAIVAREQSFMVPYVCSRARAEWR